MLVLIGVPRKQLLRRSQNLHTQSNLTISTQITQNLEIVKEFWPSFPKRRRLGLVCLCSLRLQLVPRPNPGPRARPWSPSGDSLWTPGRYRASETKPETLEFGWRRQAENGDPNKNRERERQNRKRERERELREMRWKNLGSRPNRCRVGESKMARHFESVYYTSPSTRSRRERERLTVWVFY